MRLFYCAVLLTAMATYSCSEDSTGSDAGSAGTPTYATVAVYNCTDKAISVYSSPSQGPANWSYHGSTGTSIWNNKCDEAQAKAYAVIVDLGQGSKRVRVLLGDTSISSCDPNNPESACPQYEENFVGDPTSGSSEWRITKPGIQ